MRYRATLIAVALASCTAPPPPGPPPPQRLISELAGRSPGRPQNCVPTEQIQSLRLADGNGHVLLYGSGRTIWVNHLGPQCALRQDDVLITHPFGSSYCRGDIVRSVDRFSHIPGPACVLNDFVPYRR